MMEHVCIMRIGDRESPSSSFTDGPSAPRCGSIRCLRSSGSGIRCIVYDQRGCGRSDHPSQGYEFNTLADDLAVLIERIGLNDLTLAGWSLGGGVMARYLARHGSA